MPSGLPDPQTAGDTALPCRAAGRGEAWASGAVTGPRAAVHSDLSLAPSMDAAGSPPVFEFQLSRASSSAPEPLAAAPGKRLSDKRNRGGVAQPWPFGLEESRGG